MSRWWQAPSAFFLLLALVIPFRSIFSFRNARQVEHGAGSDELGKVAYHASLKSDAPSDTSGHNRHASNGAAKRVSESLAEETFRELSQSNSTETGAPTISLVALTYNTEMAKEFPMEAEYFAEQLLSAPGVNLGAVCTQETQDPGMSASLRNALDHSKWALVSARNEGTTKFDSETLSQIISHQELSVAIKLPDEWNNKEVYDCHEVDIPSEEASVARWTLTTMKAPRLHAIYCISARHMTRKLIHKFCVDMKNIRTSKWGKGGVVASVSYEQWKSSKSKSRKCLPSTSSKARRHKFKVALACAHLDAASSDIREKNVRAFVAHSLNQAVLQKEGYKLYSKDINGEKYTQKLRERALNALGRNGDDLDAMVVLGDLNYRLPVKGKSTVTRDVAKSIVDHVLGRINLWENDPLGNPGQELTDPDVFGFHCNNLGRQLPSYKVKASTKSFRPCHDLRWALSVLEDCKLHSNQSTCSALKADKTGQYVMLQEEQILQNVLQCYKSRGKKKKEWPLKGEDFQLGWLDRICWRSFGKSKYSVAEDQSFAQAHINKFPLPYVRASAQKAVEAKELSDHFPVLSKIIFSDKTAQERKLQELREQRRETYKSLGSAGALDGLRRKKNRWEQKRPVSMKILERSRKEEVGKGRTGRRGK